MKDRETAGRKAGFPAAYMDYIVIACVYLLLHLFMHTDYWDDLRNANTLVEYNYNMIRFAISAFYSWTSRILIQPVLVVFSGIPNIVWKITDVGMILLLYHYMYKLAVRPEGQQQRKERIWRLLFFLCFPYSLMATAGWIATTVTYTWTFAAFFYCIYFLLENAEKEKVSVFSCVLYGLAIFWVGNFNITSVSLLFLLAEIYLLYRKSGKSKGAFWGLCLEGGILTGINLVLMAVSPGNRIRNLRDAEFHHTADLLELTLPGKLRMGINSTFYHFVSVPNAVLFITCAVLAVCTWKKSKKMLQRGISLIPLLLDIFWSGYMFLAYTVQNKTLTYVYPDGSFTVCPKAEQYPAMLSAIVMLGCICYLLLYLTEFDKMGFVLTGILVFFGLLPQIALGFTTTVSTSSIRMSAFLYMAFMVCDYAMVSRSDLLKEKTGRTGLYLMSGMGALFNVLQIIRHILVYG